MLLCLLLVVFFALRSDGAKVVILAQVAHRHGARGALVAENLTLICGDPEACGQLNDAGKVMLEQVGSWARSRYITGNDSTTAFMANQTYSPTKVRARSTDIARTLQSADGFLRGFFPELNNFFPVINTVDFWTDSLLVVDALAAFFVPYQAELEDEHRALEAFITSLLHEDVVRSVGRELSLDLTCSPEFSLAECALQSQDVMASYNSVRANETTNQSKLSLFPLAASLYANYSAIRNQSNFMHFSYNASSPTDLAHGALGQNLAQEIVLSMRQRIDGTAPKPYLFKEWSAHDSTVMPLCATLGHDEMMLPLFGQSYFFELLNDTDAANDATRYSVRAFYGAPEQTPGTYRFDPQPFELHCVNASGWSYTSTSDCPLEDFARYIALSIPRSAAGLCYVAEDVLENIGCQGTNESVPVNSLCPFFRTRCPTFACAKEYYYNASESTCAPILQRNVNGVRTETAAAMIAAAVVAGGLIGAIIMKLILGRKGQYSKLND